MKRNSERRKELQKAEYQNWKEGMETGLREKEESTEGTADRGKREEGKRKNGKLSSRERTEVDERKRKGRKKPKGESKREAPEEQLWE